MRLTPFSATARIWAAESTCVKKQVGAVIFNKKTKKLLSVGYNGTIAGKAHCDRYFCKSRGGFLVETDLIKLIPEAYWAMHVPFNVPIGESESGDWCDEPGLWYNVSKEDWDLLHHKFAEKYEVHAEQNAVYNMLKLGTDLEDTENLVLLSTLEPCAQCAKLAASIGIQEVYFLEPYNKKRDPSIFETYGMEYRRVDGDEDI